MEDFRKQELSIGDKVAFIGGWSGSSIYLKEGYIAKITSKRIIVADNNYDTEYTTPVKPTRIVKLTQ